MAAGDTSPKQITHVFDYLGRDIKLGQQEAIQWKVRTASRLKAS
jgi:hypothetical protein